MFFRAAEVVFFPEITLPQRDHGGAIFGRQSRFFSALRRHFRAADRRRRKRKRVYRQRGERQADDPFDRLKVRLGHGGGGGQRLRETARRTGEESCGRRGFDGTRHLIVSTAALEQT